MSYQSLTVENKDRRRVSMVMHDSHQTGC